MTTHEPFYDLNEVLEPVLAAMPVPYEVDYRDVRVPQASELQISASGLRVAVVSRIRPGAGPDYNGVDLMADIWTMDAEDLSDPEASFWHTAAYDKSNMPGNVQQIRRVADPNFGGYTITMPRKGAERRGKRFDISDGASPLLVGAHAAWLERRKEREPA